MIEVVAQTRISYAKLAVQKYGIIDKVKKSLLDRIAALGIKKEDCCLMVINEPSKDGNPFKSYLRFTLDRVAD